jgi:putative hydrolase of the HAD superfamily
MAGKIDAIIFDLGGVFIHIDYLATVKAFEKIGFSDANVLYSQSVQADLFQQYEIGAISTPHFINKLLALSNKTISPNQVVQAWNAMIGEFEQNSITVLKELQGKARLFLLSNTNQLHLDLVHREWNKFEIEPMEFYFEKMYVSHQFGKRKPHPETFLSVCNHHNLIPEKTLFIDDSIQHIDGAQKAGLQTVHLTSIHDLPTIITTLFL